MDEMTQSKWDKMTSSEKDAIRDLSDLSPQLLNFEGWRVEAVDMNDERRRFIVSKSTGWRPVHLEVSRRNSRGGIPAAKRYVSVTRLYRVH